MVQKILAIDPGKDVGFSTNFTTEHSWQVRYGEYPNGHASLWTALNVLNPDVILCERFDFRQAKRGVNLIASEYIGVVKLYAQTNNKELILVSQDKKSDKNFWDVKKLKYLGLYIAGDAHKDAMDALRHRLHYELNNGIMDIRILKDLD